VPPTLPTLAACALLSATAISHAADPPAPLHGTLIIHGGGAVADGTIKAFVTRAQKLRAPLTVVTSPQLNDPQLGRIRRFWLQRGLPKVSFAEATPTTDPRHAALLTALKGARAVWIEARQPVPLTPLKAVIDSGGVVGGALVADLLPFSQIETGYEKSAAPNSLAKNLTQHPGHLGFGIESHAALLIEGRELHAIGSGRVHLRLPASKTRKTRTIILQSGAVRDYVATTRAAQARAGDPFPPKSFPEPELAGGSVFLVGGGPTPRRALEAFISEAGGESARIVIIHSATADRPVARHKDIDMFHNVGAKNLRLVHADDRAQANSAKTIAHIDAAGGVWFTGGRQWRLADRYLDKPFRDALLRLLVQRDGAVGGTSAGATFCGDYLLRGDPLGNNTLVAEGYERGLGLLPGLAVDQHFSQRERLPDLIKFKRRFPQLLPIGIDESTAAIITGSTLRVGGLGSVTILDRRADAGAPRGDEQFTILERGDRYDLKKRETSFRWPRFGSDPEP
jgi:cyanophycinase